MSRSDYIFGFENLTHDMYNCSMNLPDTTLAFIILEGAMVNGNQR